MIILSILSRYAIEHPTENGFCIKVFSGEGILIGFHIVGTGAAELLSSVTKIPIHPSLSELMTSNSHKFWKKTNGMQLKVSAIAALGEYGNRNDLDIIEPYCKSSDVRLRYAAMGAYEKLH